MSVFDPKKLFVKLIPPATSVQPIEGRKYTLTHSDATAELFVDIGVMYNYAAINWSMRDEVLAEWQRNQQGQLQLAGRVYVDGGEFSAEMAGIRFHIFRKEMDTALKGMIYGDLSFYSSYPSLLQAPIVLAYESAYPQYRQVYDYGTPLQYLQQIYSRRT
ncbi:staygreen family protein [Ectobacillus ponti]|uniref:Staygreen family protein n=1 Tax=Ectobacillus ponti TaxID=2961894 RepID=A0AA42BUE4_9BACI|nr:staygreen family protein [Ectobacillus ponti]MCP8970453.1 staygreen family protein [Ectobacillus ponti]